MTDLTAARAALDAQPEPVAWMWEQEAFRSSTGIGGWDKKLLFCRPADEPFKRNITPLYTAPPPRQPLTDEQIDELVMATPKNPNERDLRWLIREVERAQGVG